MKFINKNLFKILLGIFFGLLGVGLLVLIAFFTVAIPSVMSSSSGSGILFHPGQQLFSEKLTFLFREPKIGDRVLFTWRFSKEGDADILMGMITKVAEGPNKLKNYEVRTARSRSSQYTVTRDRIKSRIYYPSISASKNIILLNQLIYIPITNFSELTAWSEYPTDCPGISKIKFYVPEGWKEGEGSGGWAFNGPGAENSCVIHFGYPNSPGSTQDPWKPGVYGIIKIESWLGPDLEQLKEQIYSTETLEINGREFAVSESSYSTDTQVKTLATMANGWAYIISLVIAKENYDGTLSPEDVRYLQKTGEEFIQRIKFSSSGQ